jgi:hypothetical protein
MTRPVGANVASDPITRPLTWTAVADESKNRADSVVMRNMLRKIIGGNATRAAVPIFIATMAMEYVAIRKQDRVVDLDYPTEASNVAAPVGYEPTDAAASIAMGFGSLVVNGLAEKVLEPFDQRYFQRRVLDLGSKRSAALTAALAWDFCYYWDHRWSHEHRVLWAAHVNHHSSEYYNLSTALRQSWSGTVVHWVFLPMLLAGFSPAQVARAGQLNLLYQYWVHTELVDRLPLGLEKVMNSASHHRVHHGSNPQYLDRNYAGIFIIWDRLFRSFEPEGDRVRYGLTKNITTRNPLRIAAHEWSALFNDVRHASSWRDRARHLVGPPGWQPGDTELAAA